MQTDYRSRLDALMGKNMTRGEFIMTLGLALVGMLGFSSLTGIITQEEKRQELPAYGMRDYGR